MAYVRVYVWMPQQGPAYKLGVGHGAAEVRTPEGRNYYITFTNQANKSGVSMSQNVEGEQADRVRQDPEQGR